MPHLSEETWGLLQFAVYCIVGLPVALYYIQQQGMGESIKSASSTNRHVSGLVVFTLVATWPLIAISILLNRSQQRQKSKQLLKEKLDGERAASVSDGK